MALREIPEMLRADESDLAVDALVSIMDVSATLARGDLLQAICPFIPTILADGGPQALEDFQHAVLDTATWYP